ncbi:transporter, major facilitator family protein [Candidatus Nitrosarchaeum limnium BG20]|uniref:Transporter, major facilitator family protein n=1 Tax=Candidatus Nitrosarchaeum limnium BG20 TaxID=859192 RepID=S2EAP5_9ARCH|nr:transporter, major facilitator family protein [Candidatus Nitrosarchaeum limnium BG20]
MTRNILLSLTVAQKKIAIGSFLGWSLDGYDIVLMLLVIPSISQLFFPSEDHIFSILATFASYTVTLIMRPLGSVIFGIYGDKFGRKKSMIITILGFSIATFAVGLLPTYAVVGVLAPIFLISVRLIQGIFAGGEWGSGAVLTIESIPKQKRGLLSGFLQSGFSFGFLLAAISFQIITILFPGNLFEEIGWRMLFFTGIIPGFVALFVRLSMDESPLWVKKNKESKLEKTPLRSIVLGKIHRKEFLLCAAIMTGLVYMYHGSISVLPTYLGQFGSFEKKEIALIMIYATASSWIGMIVTGWLSQKIGRKKSMLIFVSASILVSIPLATMILDNVYGLIFYVIVFAFVVSTASGPIPAYFSERFPTQIRNSAAGFSYNAGLIFGSWSPLIALYLMSGVPKPMIPVALGINIIIGSIILIIPTLLSRETRDIDL